MTFSFEPIITELKDLHARFEQELANLETLALDLSSAGDVAFVKKVGEVKAIKELIIQKSIQLCQLEWGA